MHEVYHAVQLAFDFPSEIPTKKCSICKEPKPYDAFYKDKHREDGHEVRCKECLNKRNKELYYINREDRLAQKKRDHFKHKEERNAKNREYSQHYHERNKERTRERGQKWEQSHPEQKREKWRRYNARKKAAAVGEVNYEAILERDGYVCHICEKPIDATRSYPEPGSLCFDHVKPLAGIGESKGVHAAENIKPAHLVCNDRKGTRLLHDMTPFQRRGV